MKLDNITRTMTFEEIREQLPKQPVSFIVSSQPTQTAALTTMLLRQQVMRFIQQTLPSLGGSNPGMCGPN